MKSVEVTVYKAEDGKTFLKEADCLKYEELLENTQNKRDIIEFLIREGWSYDEVQCSLYAEKGPVHGYCIKLVSNRMYIEKYSSSSTTMKKFLSPATTDKMEFKLCSLASFKYFYTDLLITFVD